MNNIVKNFIRATKHKKSMQNCVPSKKFKVSIFCLQLFLLGQLQLFSEINLNCEIDPSKKTHKIDEKVYGQFLEHIYRSCNGGLWGDIIWNRSFEVMPAGGIWALEDDEIVLRNKSNKVRLDIGDRKWTNYEINLQFQLTSGKSEIQVFYRLADHHNHYIATFGAQNNKKHIVESVILVEKMPGKNPVVNRKNCSEPIAGTVEPLRWYDLKIRCQNDHTQIWLDNTKIFDFHNSDQKSGCFSIGSNSSNARFKNIKVSDLEGVPLFAGIPNLKELSGQALGWKPFGHASFNKTIEGDGYNGKNCQKIVSSGGDCGIRIDNLHFRKNDSARGSLWLKGVIDETITVRLKNGTEKILEQHIRNIGSSWKEHPIEICSPVDLEDASLEIALQGNGEVYIDQVSLMPESFLKNGGYRTDLYDAVKKLAPPIIRWPGGSFVSQYRWKDGIGPQSSRKSYPFHIWDDQDTNNLGTDEFIALCRKLGSEPVIAVNVGRWDNNANMDQYLQEACDWLEYCNGSEETKWGKVRASNGNKAPYNVKYWQIDNEPWPMGAQKYADYLKLFSIEMRKIDPTIKVIACAGVPYGKTEYATEKGGLDWDKLLFENVAVYFDYLDTHCYVRPENFQSGAKTLGEAFKITANQISNSKNPNIKIFMGEWNMQSIDWRTGLFAGELLNIFEQNPIVGMACPALFLRHVSASGWNNAFINFNQANWFPAPNYVVMKLWREHYQPNAVSINGDISRLVASATVSDDGKCAIFKYVNKAEDKMQLTIGLANSSEILGVKHLVVHSNNLDLKNTIKEPHLIRPLEKEAKLMTGRVSVIVEPLSTGLVQINLK